jgi:hypothetical protein
MIIQGRGIDRHLRMGFEEHPQAFRRGHQRHQADRLVRHAALVQHIHRRHGGIAGGQHGIAEDEDTALWLRQLHEILHRPLGLGVAVHADMAHARRGDQLLEAVGHAEAGAQDRHDRHLLAGDGRRVHGRQRRFDPLVRHRQVARDLVAHQQPDLPQQLAELDGGRALVAHQAELMLDQRVIEHMQIGKLAAVGGHGESFRNWRPMRTEPAHMAAMARNPSPPIA